MPNNYNDVVKQNKKYLTKAQVNSLAAASKAYGLQNAGTRAGALAESREQYDTAYRGLQNIGLAGNPNAAPASGEVPRLQTQVEQPLQSFNQRLMDVENRRLSALGSAYKKQTVAARAAAYAARQKQLAQQQAAADQVRASLAGITAATNATKLQADQKQAADRAKMEANIRSSVGKQVAVGAAQFAAGIEQQNKELDRLRAAAQVLGTKVDNAFTQAAEKNLHQQSTKATGKANITKGNLNQKTGDMHTIDDNREAQKAQTEAAKAKQALTEFTNQNNYGYDADVNKREYEAAQKRVDDIEKAMDSGYDMDPNLYRQAQNQRDIAKLKMEDPLLYASYVVIEDPKSDMATRQKAADNIMQTYDITKQADTRTDAEYAADNKKAKNLQFWLSVLNDREAADDEKAAAEKGLKSYNVTPEQAKEFINQQAQARTKNAEYEYYKNAMMNSLTYAGKKPAQPVNVEETDQLYRAVNQLAKEVDYNDPYLRDDIPLEEIQVGETYVDNRLKYLTEDEINAYNYIYETEGLKAANQYIKDNEAMRNVRAAADGDKRAKELVNKNFGTRLGANLMSVAANTIGNVPAMVEKLVTGAYNIVSDNMGNRNALWIDTSDRTHEMANFATGIRSETSRRILENNPGTSGQVYNFLYQGGMSMADSAVAMGFAYMGAPAMVDVMFFSSAGNEAYKDAMERGASQEQALAAGVLSGAAEAIFEHASIENFLNLDYQGKGRFIRNMLSQAGVEASEEVNTEIANILTDAFIMEDKSAFNLEVQKLMNSGMSKEDAQRKALIDQGKDVFMAGLGGLVSGLGFGVFGAVPNAASQISTGRDAKRTGVLDNYVQRAALLGGDAQRMANEVKESSKVSDRLAGALVQTVNKQVQESIASEGEEASPEKGAAMQTIMTGEKLTTNGAKAVMDTLGADTVKEMGYDTSSPSAFAKSYNARLTEYGVAPKAQAQTSEARRAGAGYADWKRDIRNNATISDNARAQMRKGVVDVQATAAKSEAANRVWANPEQGMKFATAEGNMVTPMPGNMTAVARAEQERTGFKARTEATKGNVTYAVAGMEAREGLTNEQKYNEIQKGLTKEAQRKAKLYEALSDALGVKMIIHDVMTGTNGYIDEKGNMHVVLSGKHSVLRVAAHELTHWMKDHAANEYAAMRSHLIKEVGQERFDRLVKQKAKEYGIDLDTKNGKVVADDEVCAELCERMLSNEDALERFAEKDTAAAKTLKEHLLKILNAIKQAFKRAENRDFGESWSDLIKSQDTIESWVTGLQKAIENADARAQTNEGQIAQTAGVTTADQQEMIDEINDLFMSAEDAARAENKKAAEANADKGTYVRGIKAKEMDAVLTTSIFGDKENYEGTFDQSRSMVARLVPEAIEVLKDGGEAKEFNEHMDAVFNAVLDNYTERTDGDGMADDIPARISVDTTAKGDLKYQDTNLFAMSGKISKALGRKVTLVSSSKDRNAMKLDELWTDMQSRYNLSDAEDFSNDITKLLDYAEKHGGKLQSFDEAYGRKARAGAIAEMEANFADAVIELVENQAEDNYIHYSLADDDLSRRLDDEEMVPVYRAMQIIDGKLYPPMAAKVKDDSGRANLVEPTEIGKWYVSDERPDLIDAKTGTWKLNKGNGSSIQAAYNPYFHTSLSPLNDQFSSAYKRDNLVVVEGYVPKSELTSKYKAQYAKDAVGAMKWHSGPVSSHLSKPRTVILSRYFKANRVLSNSEVAAKVANLLKGENVSIPQNVVTPGLYEELNKLGVPTSARFSIDADYMRLAEKRNPTKADTQKLETMVRDAAKAAGYTVRAYHGTPTGGFTVFDPVRKNFGKALGDGVYFTSSKRTAENYTYKNRPSADAMNPMVYDTYLNIGDDYVEFDFDDYGKKQALAMYELKELIKNNPNKNLVVKNIKDNSDEKSTVYVVKSPSQVKSADLITRNNNGNIIPLSERFNTGNEDIRYDLDIDAYKVQEAYALADPEAFQRGLESLKDVKHVGTFAMKDISRFLDASAGGNKELRDNLRDIFEKPHSEATGRYARGVERMQQRVLDIAQRAGVCDEKGRHFDAKKSAAIQNIGEGFSNTPTDLEFKVKDADRITVRAYEPGTEKLCDSERDYTLSELKKAYGTEVANAVWDKAFRTAENAQATGGKNDWQKEEANTRRYTLADLQTAFPNDWQQLEKAAQEFREMYDEYIRDQNNMLAAIYPIEHEYEDVEKLTAGMERKEQRRDQHRAETESRISKLDQRLEAKQKATDERVEKLEKSLSAKEKEIAGKKRTDTKAYAQLREQADNLQADIANAKADLAEFKAGIEAKKQALRDELKQYEDAVKQELSDMGKAKADMENAIKTGDSLKRMHRLQYRSDYFHHFQELASGVQNLKAIFTNNTDQDIAPAIVGKSENTKAKTRWAGYYQKRTGANYTADAINGMLKYGQLAEYKLAFDPLTAYLREVTEQIRKLDPNTTNRDGLIRYLMAWTDNIAGKSHKIDRVVSDAGVAPRKAMQILQWINSRVIQNTLLFNMRSSLVQISNITNAKSIVRNNLDWMNGLRSWALAAKGDEAMAAIMSQSNFLASRYMDNLQLTGDMLKTAKGIGGWMLGALDEVSCKATWWAAYQQYTRNPNAKVIKNMNRTYESAVDYADDVCRRTHAGRGVGELAPAMTSKVVNFVAPFQVEVNNTWQLLKDNVKQKNYLGLLSTGLSVFLFNAAFEAIVGATPLGFDFIRAVMDIAMGAINDDPEDDPTVKSIGQRLAGELVGGLPFASQLVSIIGEDNAKKLLGEDNDATRYGNTQIGISAMMNAGKGLKDIATGLAEGRKVNWIDDLDDLLNLTLPFGAKQLTRSIQGIGTVAKGYAGKYDKNGEEKLQFVTDQDIMKYIQAGLFGKWSLREASEYFGEERLLPLVFGKYDGEKSATGSLIDAKEYKGALDIGIDGKQYISLKSDMKGYSTITGKRAEMMHQDFTPEQKAQLDALLFTKKDQETKSEGAIVYQKNSDGEWKVKADYTNPDMFALSESGDKIYTGTVEAMDKTGLPQEKAAKVAEMWDGTKTADNRNAAFRKLLMENKDLTVAQKEALDKQYIGNKYTADYSDPDLYDLSISNHDLYVKAKDAKSQGIPVKQFTGLYEKKQSYSGENRADYMRTEIMNSNLSAKQKEKLDDLIVSDKGFNPDYSSQAWFEVSMLGESQYKEAKQGAEVGLKPETYLDAYEKSKTINGKDENGKTRRNLKKKRVNEYLDGLTISAPVRDYLYHVVFGYK